MEERQYPENMDDVVDLGKYWAALRLNGWKIIVVSLAVGMATLIVMLRMPDIYQATAVIPPAIDEKRQYPALGVSCIQKESRTGASAVIMGYTPE